MRLRRVLDERVQALLTERVKTREHFGGLVAIMADDALQLSVNLLGEPTRLGSHIVVEACRNSPPNHVRKKGLEHSA